MGTFPIKLCFINSENVRLRFDMVLSAASFIDHALKKGYDESDIFGFLYDLQNKQKMNKIEVRCAIFLQCEYSNLLAKKKNYKNDLFSNFLASEYAQNTNKERNSLGLIAIKEPQFTPSAYSESNDLINNMIKSIELQKQRDDEKKENVLLEEIMEEVIENQEVIKSEKQKDDNNKFGAIQKIT